MCFQQCAARERCRSWLTAPPFAAKSFPEKICPPCSGLRLGPLPLGNWAEKRGLPGRPAALCAGLVLRPKSRLRLFFSRCKVLMPAFSAPGLRHALSCTAKTALCKAGKPFGTRKNFLLKPGEEARRGPGSPPPRAHSPGEKPQFRYVRASRSASRGILSIFHSQRER